MPVAFLIWLTVLRKRSCWFDSDIEDKLCTAWLPAYGLEDRTI
jgi:hypothetical protein